MAPTVELEPLSARDVATVPGDRRQVIVEISADPEVPTDEAVERSTVRVRERG